jgi:4a-hydroxytetrahydrobiopterin dehydratase
MSMNLSSKKCIPCSGIGSAFTPDEIKKYLAELQTPWQVIDNKKITHEFTFKDFTGAIAFINRIAPIAEAEGHHPDIHAFYNRVIIDLWTHELGGLMENDFILASKIEELA